MNHLIKATTKHLDHLSTAGYNISLSPNGLANFKVKLVLAIFDLPAKATALSCKQFNGKYGCTVCLHPGKLVSRRRVYLPTHKYRMRTHKKIIEQAQRAIVTNKPVKGIKGVYPLQNMLIWWMVCQ